MVDVTINSNSEIKKIGNQAVEIRTPNPDNSNNPRSYLNQDIALGAELLPVVDTTGINVGSFVVLGAQGGVTTEIIRVTGVNPDVSLTCTPTENLHASGELLQVIHFNKLEIWRGNYEQDNYVIIATLDVNVQNPQNITQYYDTSGDQFKWYQVSFYNDYTQNRVFSPVFQGGLHEWATIADVRMQSDFRNETGYPDENIKYSLQQAYASIVIDGFAWRRGDIVNKQTTCDNGEVRYYFNNKFIADGNKDGVVDINDLTVWEFDCSTDYEITDQVAILNVLKGYIVLKDGYPRNNRSVKCDYYFAKRPHEEIAGYLKECSVASAISRMMTQEQQLITKKGVTSYSTDGVNVSKSISDYRQVIDDWSNRYKRYIWQIKPLYVRGVKIGGYEAPYAQWTRFRGWY